MDDFPSNSRRMLPTDKVTPTPSMEEPKLDKVISGKVVKRKKPLGRRLLDTFFAEDSESVFAYVVKEIFVPALQNTAVDMFTQGLEKAVWGVARTPSRTAVRGNVGAPRTHISYDRPGTMRPGPIAQPAARRPTTQPSAVDIGQFILDTQIDAQIVMDNMFDTVREYGSATVANLCELVGQTSVYTDHKWGWTDLTQMTARRVREGYLIVLPPVEDLDPNQRG